MIHCGAGDGIHRLEASIALCGPDLSVCICGGTHYHVGACALGMPRQSLRDSSEPSASVSVLTAVGHKEDELVKEAAHRLTKRFCCRVAVSAGVHIDDATKEDIQLLWLNFEKLLEEMELKLSSLKDA